MARIDSLNNFLTDVADSIREKKGTSEKINPVDFDTEIDAIEVGGGVDIEEYYTLNPVYLTGSVNVSGIPGVALYVIKKIPDMLDYDPGKNLNYAFANLFKLKEIPKIMPTTKVQNWGNTFFNCRTIETIPECYDFSGATTLSETFSTCSLLKKLPENFTLSSSVTRLDRTFYQCGELEGLEDFDLDLSNITYVYDFWTNAKKMKKIPNWDFSNIESVSNFFTNTGIIGEVELTFPKAKSVRTPITGDQITKITLNIPVATFISYLYSSSFYVKEFVINIGEDLTTSTRINATDLFNDCRAVEKITLNCSDNCKFTTFQNWFKSCSKLVTIEGKLNASLYTYGVSSTVFSGCRSLVNFPGFKDLGAAYETSRAENYYKNDFTTVTTFSHDSLMNIINNLYDIATKGCKKQLICFSPESYSLLTEEDIAIATNKGWTVQSGS